MKGKMKAVQRKILKIISEIYDQLKATTFCLKIQFYKPCSPEELLVLILDSEESPYREIRVEGSYPTWVSDLRKAGIEYYYYYGNAKENYIHDDAIKLNCPDNAYTKKMLGSLETLFHNQNPTKYLVRTNSSSYWRIGYLRKVISFLKTNKIDYFGISLLNPATENNYVSGAGIILSPAATDIILRKSDQIDCHLFDDIAIGELLLNRKIPICRGFRLTLSKKYWKIKAVFLGIFHYHFRCKTKSSDSMKRLNDINKMKFLYQFLPGL
jgi:hypothetical protein